MVKKFIEKTGDLAAGAVDAVTAPVEYLTEVMGSLRDVTATLVSPFEELAGATEKMTQAFGGSGGFKGFVEAATAVDSLRANLQQATGQGEKYKDMAIDMQAGMVDLGISTEIAGKAFTTLHNSFAEFTLLAPQAQKDLAEQATAFTKLGISIEESTANYDLLIKGMGMGADEAKSTSEKMAKLALAIGVAPKQMAKDFAQAAPKLARYGKSGVKVFEELAIQSKATGMSMQSLLNVAGGFDTFEDAADKAGRLNAMLGGNLLNSIDMLTASESERIDMIRQSMAATGQNWDMLDRFQKKGIAGAVGISDMAEAMRLFGTEQASLEDLKDKADPALVAQQNLTKAMRDGTSIAERFAAIFDRLGNIYGRTLEPIFTSLSKFMTGPNGLESTVSIFEGFNKQLKRVIGWWTSLDKGTKGMIKNVAGMIVKAMAFSFAIKEVHNVLSPVMDLLTNKWVIVGAGIVWIVKNWDNMGEMIKNAATYLESLDKKIIAFFDRNKDNPFIKDFIKPAYIFLKDKIPLALREFGNWFDTNKPKVVGFFKDLKKEVGGWLGNIWEDFKGSKGVFQGGLVATLGRWGDKIMSVFRMIKGAMMNLIGSLAAAMDIIPVQLGGNLGRSRTTTESLGTMQQEFARLKATGHLPQNFSWGNYESAMQEEHWSKRHKNILTEARVQAGGKANEVFAPGGQGGGLGGIISSALQNFDNGGMVTGVGNQIIEAQAGEYVLPKHVVDSIRGGQGGQQPIIINLYGADGKKVVQQIATSAQNDALSPNGLKLSIPTTAFLGIG